MGQRLGLIASCLVLASCTRTLPIRIELEDARAPSPRSDGFRRNVQTLQVIALVGGRLEILPDTGANEGEVRLEDTIAPSVRRLVVLGLDEDRQVFASGQSAPLDLLRDPPEDGIISIYFSRVGELSLTTERGGARTGLRAIELSDSRVLFAGGREGNCTPSETEIYGAIGSRTSVGPILSGGRAGDFHLVSLPNGEVIVAGGVVGRADCATATAAGTLAPFAWLRFDPLGSDTRTPQEGRMVRTGAAISAVSDQEVVLAGGVANRGASAEVLGFTFVDEARLRVIGNLNAARPRAGASAVPITERRILLVGGSATDQDRGALDTASAFVPQGGREIDAVIPLQRRVIEPGVATTLAGSVWVAGGRNQAGAATSTIQALVVRRESESPFGDTSAMPGALPGGVSKPTIILAGAAGALVVPDDESPPAFIDAFGDAISVARDQQLGLVGSLVGGAIGDGTIVLRDASGLYVRFNPGPAAVLGAAGPAEGRMLGRSSGPLGISFLRPGHWERNDAGITNTTPIIGGGSTPPQELAVLGGESFGDFELEVAYTPGPMGRPALIFAFAPGQYAYYELSTFSALLQVGAGKGHGCGNTIVTSGLGEPRPHTVIVRRAGLSLTLQADGGDSLVCDAFDADSRFGAAGPLALGVTNGQVTFERVRVSAD